MKSLTLLFFLSPIFLFSQNVGIGTNNPDASAKLEIQSTSGGVLIPRLTIAERDNIPSPIAIGLLIYNTENTRFEFWNGSAWGPIAAASPEISDADGDTKISTEMTSDEDKVRITVGGNEIVEMDAKTIHIKTAQKSTYIGEDAGSANITTLNNWNTHLGYKSGEKGTNGTLNTLLGAFAGANKANLGNENVMVGLSAGYDNEGDSNTFVGRDAGRLSGSGNDNTFLGHSAGRSATGSGNVMIGHDAGKTETGNNKLYINNSDTSSPLIYGEFDNNKVQINGSLNINGAYDFPNSDGANGAALITDGMGNLSWSENESGAFEDINGLIRPRSANQQDFIVGRDALPLNGEIVVDTFFFFDKSKGALRVGSPAGTSNWSPDSIGDFSIAMGRRTKALGDEAISIGSESKANGIVSIALGFNAQALGNLSNSLGFGSQAYGGASLSLGNNALAIGAGSSAIGASSKSRGNYSTAIGFGSLSEGDYSIALPSSISNGEYSIAGGSSTSSNGFGSASFGIATFAESYGEMAVGTWNTRYTPASTYDWNTNDRLFVVGNGTAGNRSDAMVILKNGNAIFPDGNILVGRDAMPNNGENIDDTFMFFDKEKGALRVGSPDGTSNWSPDSIGDFSIAMGSRTKALGNTTVSIGSESRAIGDASIALGYNARAIGELSNALGVSSLATGGASLSLGNGSIASGIQSSAIGVSSFSKGLNSAAIGYGSESEGDYSVALGSTISNGDYSISGGYNTNSNGFGSASFGLFVFAESFGEVAMGTFNTRYIPSSIDAWNANDRSFVVGNGNYNSPSDAMVILKNGNTGIGTSLPEKRLHMKGSFKIEGKSNDANLFMQSTTGNENRVIVLQDNNEDVFFGDIDGENRDVIFRSNGSNRIWIKNNGNIGIGNSSPNERLHVQGNICYTGSISACSDLRYKRDFSTIQSALTKVNQLNGLYYFWNQDQFPKKEFSNERQIGVIAQEVEVLFPEMVLTDADGYKSVDYSRLTPVLIEAVKELTEQNLELSSRMDKMEKQLGRLMEMNN